MTLPSYAVDLSCIRAELRGSALVVWLSRPERLNALTAEMLDELRALVAAAECDPDVMGLVITGEGRGFCSGADADLVDAVVADPESAEAGARADGEADAPGMFTYFTACAKPIIAAVNGPAAGGGFALAMMADLRFVSPDAVLAPVFATIGMLAEHGTSWILPRTVGPSRALDLLWRSPRLSGAEAVEVGLADELVPHDQLLDRCVDYIDELARTVAPRAVRDSKRLVYRGLGMGIRQAMDEMQVALWHPFERGDVAEGLAARADGRPPRFTRVGRGDHGSSVPPP